MTAGRAAARPRRARPCARLWQGLALLLCALLLASVARFYHPGLGFSALLIFPAGHAYELPALQAIPHYEYGPTTAYDGALYVQLAMDPLLKDPAIDATLDAPAYRARRILFSWTAYLLGFGKPAWILQAYALQNVAAWLLLAWLMTRWVPPVNARNFALWAAVMFSHGLLSSVRMALLDGPSMLLLALGVAASDQGRAWLSAAIVGVAGLGRETNVLAGIAVPWPRGWRGWVRVACSAVIVLFPLLLWQDYLYSIYWSTARTEGASQITLPLVAYVQKWQETLRGVRTHGFGSASGWTLLTVIALSIQVAYVAWSRRWREPWWRLAAVYAVLMLVVHMVVWQGYPGAVTRVVLPLTFGFNMLLAREPTYFWIWYVLGNLHLVAALHTMPIPGIPPPF